MFYFSYQRADLVLAPIDVAKGEETEQTQEVNGSPRRQHGLAYPEEKGVDVAKRPWQEEQERTKFKELPAT